MIKYSNFQAIVGMKKKISINVSWNHSGGSQIHSPYSTHSLRMSATQKPEGSPFLMIEYIYIPQVPYRLMIHTVSVQEEITKNLPMHPPLKRRNVSVLTVACARDCTHTRASALRPQCYSSIAATLFSLPFE